MEVTFYSNFKKRINSTKRPTGGVSKTVYLKEPTDLHNPILKVQGNNLFEYNYFSIGNTYYYITSEVRCPNNWVEYTGNVDAMATCADDIKSTTAFIERCSGGSANILDTLVPAMTTRETLFTSAVGLPWAFSGGRYIVSFTNLVQPAVMTQGEFSGLYDRLNDPSIYEQLKDLLTGGIENFITGATFIPMNVPAGGSIELKTNSIPLGISVQLLLTRYETQTLSLGLSDMPDSILKSSAYTEMELYLPFVGSVQLSIDPFMDDKSVTIQCGIDYGSGGLFYIIKNSSQTIATYNGSCAVSVGIGYSGSNLISTVGGAVTAIGSLALSSWQGAIAGAGLAYSGLRGSTGQLSAASGNNAFAMDTNIRLSVSRKGIPEDITTKSNVIGLPTYRTLSLGSLTGFVKCINATIESSEEMSVVQECNNYLNTGAWIE